MNSQRLALRIETSYNEDQPLARAAKMNIGLVALHRQSYKDDFSQYLGLSSLENLLRSEGHTTRIFPTIAEADSSELSVAEAMDKILILGNPFEDPRCVWGQWLLSIRPQLVEKTIFMGLRGFSTDSLVEEQKQVFQAASKHHPLSACDRNSREQLAKIVSNKAAVLTGMPVYWAEGYSFRLKRKSRLFMPAHSDPTFQNRMSAYGQLVRKFYRRWNQVAPVLYAGMHSQCLDLGAPSDAATFYQPAAPRLLLNALLSADALVAGHITPLQVATQSSVPGVLLSNDVVEKAVAESLGIPHLEMHLNSQAAELVHRTEELLSRYPWEAVKQKQSALLEKTTEFLVDAGVIRKGVSGKKKSPAPIAERNWATVASDKNLAQVLGWVENILSVYEGRNQFHILCASRSVEAALEGTLRTGSWKSYSLHSLWSEDEWQSCRRFPETQLLLASKPKFLLQVLAQSKAEVFYSDADIVFFRDPVELSLEADAIACFVARYPDSSHDCARNGVYSASLFSVQQSAEPFLNWWASFALQPRSAGLRVDGFLETKLLDSAPLLFPSIKILREAGIWAEAGNIASTSISRPSWPGEVLVGFQGTPVAAFRCVGLDALGAHEIKSGWDQLASFFSQNRKISESNELRRAVWLQQRLHWPRLDKFFCVQEWLENHIPLLAHVPKIAEVRFFTFGVGQWAVRLAAWLGLAALPSLVRQTSRFRPDPVHHLWKTWQQTLLRRATPPAPLTARHTHVA